MRSAIVGLVVMAVATTGCSRSDAAALTSGAVGTAGHPAAPAADAATNGQGTAAALPSGATAAHTAAVEREVTIPAGTRLSVILDTPVGSDTSRVEQRVTAHLARPVVVNGAAAVPAGSTIGGVVTDATRSAKVKGRAHVALRFDSLSPRGADARYVIQTASIGRTAPATKKKDALEIGAPAAGGALIGALVGGKKGALVGGAAGGGAGTAVVLSTRGKEVRLAKGSVLTVKLSAPVTVRVGR